MCNRNESKIFAFQPSLYRCACSVSRCCFVVRPFSSKNWYLLLVSVRAWFSSKISDDYPRTPVTFMWEYSTPPFPGLRITHDAFPVHGVYRTSYCSIFLRCAALFPSYKKVMLENFLRDRHKKINLYSPLQ